MQGTSLEDLQFRVGTWAARTFTQATNKTIITHLVREVGELVDVNTTPGQPERFGEEAADCFLLLLHFCERNRIDLAHHTKRKFAANQRRQWGAPDSEGVVEHIREERH